MKRLTKEEVRNCATSIASANLGRACGKLLARRIVKELLEYKEIEEKFGIDLATLFKALANGIYVYEEGTIEHTYVSAIDADSVWVYKWNEAKECDDYVCYMFSEYGETWSLTRKEME